jgi:hypothetical protein
LTGPWISAYIAVSIVLFFWGLGPGYNYELDYRIDETARCPEAVASAQGYHAECIAELIEHGPLYLGKEALAVSFIAGGVAMAGLFTAANRRWARLTAIASLIIGFVLSGLLFAMGMGDEEFLVGGTAVWLLTSGIVAFDRKLPVRHAVLPLVLSYVFAWFALLIWNEEEGERLVRGGIEIA